MLGGADNPNGELPSYITGANRATSGQRSAAKCRCPFPAGHCINVTLSYTFVSGSHGPAAGKFFNRVQQFSLLTDRIALQDRRYWRISGPSNAGIHFIHL